MRKIFILLLGLFLISFTSASFGYDTATGQVKIINKYIINDSEVVHNNISGIQGGIVGEYYHIRQSWFDELTSDIFDWITQIEGDARYLQSYTETDPLWTGNQSSYVPYTGASSNLDLGANNFFINNSVFFVNSTSGNVGIGTTEPTLGKLQVNGSTNGISIYAENNISAEDYLYHSPFPSDNYTNKQALNDLLKIKGNNGKLNHSTIPSNSISIIEKPIYEMIIIQKERTKEICEEAFNNEIGQSINICSNKTYIENITTQNQIGLEPEPQTSMGMMLGNIVKSIQRLFDWNTEQDNKITQLENELIVTRAENQVIKLELCKKDRTYSWCKIK